MYNTVGIKRKYKFCR